MAEERVNNNNREQNGPEDRILIPEVYHLELGDKLILIEEQVLGQYSR